MIFASGLLRDAAALEATPYRLIDQVVALTSAEAARHRMRAVENSNRA